LGHVPRPPNAAYREDRETDGGRGCRAWVDVCRRDAFGFCLGMGDLKSGKAVAKAVTKALPDSVDITPTGRRPSATARLCPQPYSRSL
jgi:hypothetical protein